MSQTKPAEQPLPSAMARTGEEFKTGQWQVSSVPPKQLPLVWPQISPLAEKGLAQIREDELTAEDIRQRVADGRYVLWVAHDNETVAGAVIFNVIERRRGRVLFIVLVAGRRFNEWAPTMQERLQDVMGMTGAVRMESHSRIGMEPWMNKLGWRKRAVVMEWTNGR